MMRRLNMLVYTSNLLDDRNWKEIVVDEKTKVFGNSILVEESEDHSFVLKKLAESIKGL